MKFSSKYSALKSFHSFEVIDLRTPIHLLLPFKRSNPTLVDEEARITRETELKKELEILKCQLANMQGFRAENENLKSLVESQKQEIEALRQRNHQEENEPPRVQYNVKSYLAGVKVNLEAIDKETAVLEDEINKQNS